MREKIVLIDGHSILNRAFYGVPDLTNSEGLHTNAVYGFLNIMFKMLDEEQPEYLTVTFDVHAPTFRHKMFADYKGTRKPMAEELREQVPVIKDVLRAMDIEVIEQEGLEADDLLGTISRICEELHLPAVFGAMPGGEERRQNLESLYAYAREFEASGYRGLFAFVSHLRELLERGSN